ncbi:MAG: GNAT family N-acetyltransferase [Clostridiales bacterium]|jgi:predicted acetyltransferase|nr:GNAT family N-acetyltransferase [Clostridiales bacterium]
MVRLIKPCIEYWQDYLWAVKECQRSGDLGEVKKNAAIALKQYQALEEARAVSYYWLMNGRELIGIGIFRHTLDNETEKFNGHLRVLIRPDYRGRGWGTKLVSLLLRVAAGKGIRYVLAVYPQGNGIAKAVKRNGGFVLDKISIKSEESGISEVIRCLLDTKIRIHHWREPNFKFRDVKFINGPNILLRLDYTNPGDNKYCPTYKFDIMSRDEKVGYVDLRVGFDTEIYYSGNIGYHVHEQFRGHGYAAEASRLLLPLAKAHNMKIATITCNPDNLASARTAENIGGRYIELVKLPPNSELYRHGDRLKRRYLIFL